MFKFQEFELKSNLLPLGIEGFFFFFFPKSVVLKEKQANGKCIIRAFWYSQEHISVNAPKLGDYIFFNLYSFHTLSEKQFEWEKKEIFGIYMQILITKRLKMLSCHPDFPSFLIRPMTYLWPGCRVSKFALAHWGLILL